MASTFYVHQGKLGDDQVQGRPLTADKQESSIAPAKWGSPKSIFQALFTFLLWSRTGQWAVSRVMAAT